MGYVRISKRTRAMDQGLNGVCEISKPTRAMDQWFYGVCKDIKTYQSYGPGVLWGR